MRYINRDTGKLVATSEEELMEYYKKTYEENKSAGYIDCTLQEWIESDDAVFDADAES